MKAEELLGQLMAATIRLKTVLEKPLHTDLDPVTTGKQAAELINKAQHTGKK